MRLKSISFEYCAFRYFEQWFLREEGLYLLMRSKPKAETVRKSLQYFNVARSFKRLGEHGVAELIKNDLATVNSLDGHDAESKVDELANRFKVQFGQYNISAASKLLWLSNIDDYLIYDSRAVKGLKKLGAPLRNIDYSLYEREWRRAYDCHRVDVREATRKLPEIKTWLPYWPDNDVEIQSTINKKWFLERVFDIYLWELSGS